jgi:dTMP kinase
MMRDGATRLKDNCWNDGVPHVPFVALEGLEGTGKTTVIPLLADRLTRRGIRVAVKPEFPPGPLADEFAEALCGGLFIAERLGIPPAAAFFHLLHSEATALAVLAADAGDVVLADRYLYSHALYQGYFAAGPANFDPVRIVDAMTRLFQAIRLPLPDLVLFLDAPIETVIRRVSVREQRPIRLEEQRVLMQLHDAYHALRAVQIHPVVTIDATQSPNHIADEAAEVIMSTLAL